MSSKKLIEKLKKQTKNIEFAIGFEDEYSIVINYLQKNFAIYGSVEFNKNALHFYKDEYIKRLVTDIAYIIGKKAFLRR